MLSDELLHGHLSVSCAHIHSARLQSVLDVATGLQKRGHLSLTSIGRKLSSETSIKHRVKKVDRLLGNKKLYEELTSLYEGLSSYLLKYISTSEAIPLIVDLCYMKDTHSIQMLSAEVALKGRSLPMYREVFEAGQLKHRASTFLENLSRCLPSNREVLVIMDAGFAEDWFEAISAKKWYWLARARGKKYIKLSDEHDWVDARALYDLKTSRAKHYGAAYITKNQPRSCRVVIKGPPSKQTVCKKPKRLPRNYHSANGNYQRLAKEPWVLVTNLTEKYTPSDIVNAYKKRMQIEESFRDVKSHQFGLSARHIRTTSIYRWAIAMLLAAIVQVTLWVIGVVGHHQGMQAYFQTNTVRNRKVFSYFYLGRLIVEHNKLPDIFDQFDNLGSIINQELAKKW